MKRFRFKAAGLSGQNKFKVEGELRIEDHESPTDAAAQCVRRQLGTDNLQFTRIATEEIVPKPFGWEVTYEYRDGTGAIARGTVNRVGAVSKARMAARCKILFVRIVEERPIATEDDYRRQFGNYDQRM